MIIIIIMYYDDKKDYYVQAYEIKKDKKNYK